MQILMKSVEFFRLFLYNEIEKMTCPHLHRHYY